MVCMAHRLQCKMPNRTNHKFPGYRAEEIDSIPQLPVVLVYRGGEGVVGGGAVSIC